MSRSEWWISLYVALLCFFSYRLTLEVKYLKEDGVTIRNAPWSVLQPALSMWQRPRRGASAHSNHSIAADTSVVGSDELPSPATSPLGLHLHADNGTCSCKVCRLCLASCCVGAHAPCIHPRLEAALEFPRCRLQVAKQPPASLLELCGTAVSFVVMGLESTNV
jgi:hypothetical protein